MSFTTALKSQMSRNEGTQYSISRTTKYLQKFKKT